MPTLAELAQSIRADLAGEPNAHIIRARPFDTAGEGDVTLAADRGYLSRINDCSATAIIVSSPVPGCQKNLLIARNPRLAFARAIEVLHRVEYRAAGISDDLIIGEGSVLGGEPSIYSRVTIGNRTVIGDRVTLHPGVVIGNDCCVGDDTVLHANVSIYDGCRIGQRVIVHAGTVIGADGFGFVPDEAGRQVKMLQLGGVLIEDDCEIGANCAIDRGGFSDTVLRRGVKLDNLIQIGHSCEIGEDTVVAALTGFSGGTRVGCGCVSAGQVGTNQHITIGDGVVVTGQAGVTKDVASGARVAGTPAGDYNAWRRSQVLYSRLPQLVERLRRLETFAVEPAEDSRKDDKD